MKRSMNSAAAALAIIVSLAAAAEAHDAERESVIPKFAQAIGNIPGKTMRVVEVDYAPGAASFAHTHAPSAFVYAYVLSGEVESKVNGGDIRRYKAGDSWFEAPGAIHAVSRNASKTAPAKLLAVFVVDSSETKLTTPVK